jgi:Siphovirus Gp157
MDQSHAVRFEVSKYLTLKERLRVNFPTADEDTLLDTLEGITDLYEMIAAVIRSALVDEALQGGLRSRLDDMRARLGRLEERGLKKRQLALEAMTEVGLTKLEQPDFTASVRAGFPSLVVTAEDLIHEDYWVPQAPKLSRQALLSDLKQGVSVSGAQLSNGQPVLMVRTK